MTQDRPQFSICIPAYNRARLLPPLLDSIFAQDYQNFNVVICEDMSPERRQISEVVRAYSERYPGKILYYENESNCGYDANIRTLVEKANGEFCFFMGNDDLMCPGALATAADLIGRYDNVGLVLKSYAWFDGEPTNINQEVRYFNEERFFRAGPEAIRICFRRSGVISGYIIHRDTAAAFPTNRFDGSLFYQMHLTGNVLVEKNAVFTPKVLVICRAGIAYEFGNSPAERGKHEPGSITARTRLVMIGGIISILKALKESRGVDVVDEVMSDYASYFYPYIREQLDQPLPKFISLYRSFCKMGLSRYPMFHLYCIFGYALGARNCDSITRRVRALLGRSPQFGQVRQSGSL
jgi:abequosyltransferase